MRLFGGNTKDVIDSVGKATSQIEAVYMVPVCFVEDALNSGSQ